MSRKQGRFITFEGVEGVGKTTQLDGAEALLGAHGVSVVRTREPGGTPAAEAIRSVLLDPRWKGLHSDAELLLMFAARAEHVRRRVLPALEEGHWVLCDRFTDATYAYQGGGRGVSETRIAVLEDWALGALRPDLTLLLDADVDLGLRRARARGEADRFEREEREFFERVRASYLARARREPRRFRVLDASRPLEQVAAGVRRFLEDYLAEAGL